MIKRNTSSSMGTTSKLQLYKAVFVPTILYGAECWSPSSSDITEMEKMNKKLLKWVDPPERVTITIFSSHKGAFTFIKHR